jgi:MSHA biogenesis protein MshJ
MTMTWKSVAARINGLNLRERVFLFLSLLVVCVALVDTAWLAPARVAHQLALQKFDANAVELQQLRNDARVRAAKPDPARAAREDLAAVQAQTEATNRSIGAVSGALRSSTSLKDVMALFLRRYPALTLVHTSNLAADAPTRAPDAAVARAALELTVSGPFADQVRFIQSLETAMPDLRWGAVSVNAERQPPELTLQVFLVGSQR